MKTMTVEDPPRAAVPGAALRRLVTGLASVEGVPAWAR
ncbi:MAG: hypothetical protein AVDCRST_MAG69-2927 [uncultured Solirubrobacteraceae bacterium]|uniref:Uncharacterized protein n=1 Tax=uncultured Solirubrobacteraceae bacterium TaxID=1162706 RepID=A0A6J4TC51_9ACTN|nr:MAG: hypothetical protein AVDCRST_MAG69-2927 [uncultured Solirubrobacteraceae bacterium]